MGQVTVAPLPGRHGGPDTRPGSLRRRLLARTVLVLLGTVLSALLTTGPSAHAAEGPGLTLGIGADGRFTVVNTGDTPCDTSELLDGAVTIAAVGRDGVPVEPVLRTVHYADGLAHARTAAPVTVAAGATQDLTLAAPLPAGRWLAAVAEMAPSGAVLTTYPLDVPGSYQVTAVLTDAVLAGCTGSREPVTGVVLVADPGAPTAVPAAGPPPAAERTAAWVWLLAGVAAVAVVAAGARLVLRSRRRRSAGVGVVVGVVLLSLLPPPAPAEAKIVVSPGSNAAFQAAVNSCLGAIFDAGDPAGVFARAADAQKVVTIQETTYGSATTPNDPGAGSNPARGSDSVIVWNPTDTAPYADGVRGDPCSTLYHELSHGADAATGKDDGSGCAATGISVAEVTATLNENAYRRAQGLPQRTKYGGKPLPATAKDCTSKPGRPPRGPHRAECQDQPCGSVNGDPHLRTFDQLRYDLQTVGEYVLTRSTQDGFQVQVRQAAFPGSRTVSVVTAVAVSSGGDPVQVELGPDGLLRAAVADRVLSLGAEGSPVGAGIVGGVEATDRGDAFWFTTDDGSTVLVSPLGSWGLDVEVVPSAARAGTLTGLLGDFDGSAGNDLRRPDGSGEPVSSRQVPPATAREVLDGWRIAQDTSLLTHPPGTTTADFTDRTFPDAEVTVSDTAAAAARALCAARLDPSSPEFDACVVDLAVTGLLVFAEAAADRATTAVPPTTTSSDPAGTPPTDPPTTRDAAALPEPAGAVPVAPGGAATLPADGALLFSGELAGSDQVDTFDVRARAGQVGYLQTEGLNTDCQGTFDHAITLEAPTGQVMITGWDCSADARRVVFPDAGTYRLRVRADQRADGGYRFALLDSGADQDFPLVLDAPVGPDAPGPGAGRLERPGTVDRYSFTGQAGDVVYVAVEGLNDCTNAPGIFTQQISLPGPSGLLATGWTCANDPGRVLLPDTATYTFTVSGDAARTGDYGFIVRDVGPDQVFDVTPPLAVSPGQPASGAGSLERPGTQDVYRFAASAGQQLSLATDGAGCADLGPLLVTVSGPNGARIITVGTCSGPPAPIPLPEDGSYTVAVGAQGPDTGDYELAITLS